MRQDVDDRERECVLSFMKHVRSIDADCEYLRCLIAYHAAPTLLGIKPATLVCPHAGGRDLDKALKECAPCLARDFGVEVAEFRNRAGALLLLAYRPDLLARALEDRDATGLLAETGYEIDRHGIARHGIEEVGLRALLDRLGQKCAGIDFPHEIGLFLGYPASDVRMFMGCSGNCPGVAAAWRAYGDVDAALEKAGKYRAAKIRAAKLIVAGANPRDLMGGLARAS